MPEVDEFVLWRREDGNCYVQEIDKDDDDWWNKDVGWGKLTHWARIPPPGEESNQNVLWDQIVLQLNPLNIEGIGRKEAVINWLKGKYNISRK